MNFFFGLFFAIVSVRAAEMPPSPSKRLQNFEITQCYHGQCFQARARTGSLSLNGNFLSAKNATLEIKSARQTTTTCAGLRYDLISQLVTCDNRDEKKIPSLTIDENFVITNY